jgi:hypothetical protein
MQQQTWRKYKVQICIICQESLNKRGFGNLYQIPRYFLVAPAARRDGRACASPVRNAAEVKCLRCYQRPRTTSRRACSGAKISRRRRSSPSGGLGPRLGSPCAGNEKLWLGLSSVSPLPGSGPASSERRIALWTRRRKAGEGIPPTPSFLSAGLLWSFKAER